MKTIASQIKNFILHLRLHYQIFILSGPYLLGVLLSNQLSYLQLVQFFSVHILLFGGVTAYNSYFDKDEGPIGGLKNPPKMQKWMLVASWIFQIFGLLIAFYSGFYFKIIYIICALSFWMYSSPRVRLKGQPIASLVAIGVSAAVCATLLGYYANGNTEAPSLIVWIAALGSIFLITSMYPVSQVYQVEEDRLRGDVTFAVRYGKSGVKNLFFSLFPIGTLLVAFALASINILYSTLFIIGGIVAGIMVSLVIKKMTMTPSDYTMVMRVKYVGGLLFSLCMLLLIFLNF
ncbi:MAG: UbiA family prenyltransferase [Patescibacteria group bacterium]